MKIGIIGCGMIAAAHVRILRKLMQNAHLCLCDLNRSNAKKLADQFDAQGIYTSIDDLLSKERPDTVHILTPVSTHFTLAEKAFRAGCHIYVEKPITETASEYKRLFELAKKEGKVMCVGYSALGMPAVLKARKEIASGKFGRLIAVHCDFMCTWPGNLIPYGNSNHWAYSMKGGILQNMADHPASLVIDAMDGIKEHNISFCSRNVLPGGCPDLLHVALSNSDQIGSFMLSLGHGSAHRQAQYFLEGGTISVDMSRQLVSCTRGRGPQNFIKKALSGITSGCGLVTGSSGNVLKVTRGTLQREPGIVNLISNFYSAIRGEEELIIEHRTVVQVTCLLEDIWRAIDYKSNITYSKVSSQ